MFLTVFVFFTQNFPGPLKLASLGHCSCACPHSIGTSMEWHAWNVSTLQNIFGSSLSIFPEKPLLSSIGFTDFYIFVHFWIWTRSWKLQGPSLLKSSINHLTSTEFPQKESKPGVLHLGVQTISLFCCRYWQAPSLNALEFINQLTEV